MLLGDKYEKNMENCTRSKRRIPEEKKVLVRRLRIISGQISGIEQMIIND